MKSLTSICVALVCLLHSMSLGASPSQGLNLMPVPAQVTLTQGRFRVTDAFAVQIKGQPHQRLYPGATRMLRRLAGRTGLFLPQDYLTPSTRTDTAPCTITCQRPGKVVLREDESYTLSVKPDCIALDAPTDLGALRGLETLLQLLSVDAEGYYFPGVEIEDHPRFVWRGLLIDACRHFIPVDVIKRNLDGMAAVKLNVLHWHLTEDQGFRVECKTFPKLHELGSDGFYYTQAQIRDIIAYADARGIRVVPEFDIPGHATSWLVAFPDLASAPGPYTVERHWGVMNPTFDPTKPETYTFFDAFFKEMAQLFPDEYVHIGGDENNGRQWNGNAKIQTFMRTHNLPDNHALQSYFNQKILQILTRYHKKMMGWDEIFQPDIPKNIVIHSWRGKRALVKAAQRGYQVVLSNGYYVDLIQPTTVHYLNDPIPPDSPLSDQEKKLILGGEATMWSEFVNAETIDSRIWPRTAAIAERLWSPGQVKDVDDMYRRLEVTSFRLEELGLTHEKNVPMMLRRLTNNTDITPLRTLVDVIEPVKGYNRNRLRAHTSISPLTRVVDAARPDAKVARAFRKAVDAYLAGDLTDAAKLAPLVQWLNLWQDNHARLARTIAVSPILKEIETLSVDLSVSAGIGLQALAYLRSARPAPSAWAEAQMAVLKEAGKPRGQTELMIISALEELVKRVP